MQVTIKDTPGALAYASSIYNEVQGADMKNTKRNMIFWTDASVDLRTQSSPGGGAVTFQGDTNTTPDEKDGTWTEYSFGVRGHHSIHQAELVAIHQALTLAHNSTKLEGPKGIYVLTDSQTALEWIRRKKGRHCVLLLKAILALAEDMERRGCRVEVHWVPGHSHAEIPGNARANRLAVEARSQGSHGSRTTRTGDEFFLWQIRGKGLLAKEALMEVTHENKSRRVIRLVARNRQYPKIRDSPNDSPDQQQQGDIPSYPRPDAIASSPESGNTPVPHRRKCRFLRPRRRRGAGSGALNNDSVS